MSEKPQEKEALKRAPTLYAIIILKILKGLFCVAIAILVYNLSDNDLPTDYENLLHKLGLNADRKFWSDLAVKVGALTEKGLVHFAVGTLIYSLFSLVEGVGLMFRVSWAGWLAWSNGENATSPAEAIWTGVFVGIISGGVISAFAIAWIWFGARGGRRASSER